MGDDKKKSLAEEFDINNFIDKAKEHANRWANQHRWRNGGKLPARFKKFLKRVDKNNAKDNTG